jgi:heme o synthase
VFRRYYQLTKPGIVYGNALTVIAGFFLAGSVAPLRIVSFIGVLAGTSLVIASACVINNIIDRRIDKNMARTSKRSLVTGDINVTPAVMYGIVLGIIGFGLLIWLTNLLTLLLGALAYVVYIVLYGISKRKSEHGTLVGSIAGALPPVAGYTAITNRFDIGMVTLFVMLVFWQMAHFYAIAIYRRDEYKKAGVPILTVVRGNRAALIQMVIYVFGFLLASLELVVSGFTHCIYAAIMAAVSIVWLVMSVRAFKYKEGKALNQYARRLFFVSLIVNLVMCTMIAIGGYLP